MNDEYDDCLEDWERDIINKFPLLYKEYRFGIGVNKGWKDIIYELSEVLERMSIELLIQNPEAPKPTISQIKQKFGGLRWYMDNETKEMREIIWEAENKSYKVCEYCGAEGERRSGGWLMTLCDECHNNDNKEE